MIASYFPNSGWIRLDHDVLDRARATTGRGTGWCRWEETVTRLLDGAAEGVAVSEEVVP